MMHLPLFRALPALLAIACVSCKDDPKLVEKREKQQTEIATLKGELALLEEKVKNIPPDVTPALELATKDVETQTAEVARLEAELAELETRKKSQQGEFDAYRAKYQSK